MALVMSQRRQMSLLGGDGAYHQQRGTKGVSESGLPQPPRSVPIAVPVPTSPAFTIVPNETAGEGEGLDNDGGGDEIHPSRPPMSPDARAHGPIEDAEDKEQEDATVEICRRLVSMSADKLALGRVVRGGLRLHKSLLILRLVRRARVDFEMLPRDCATLLPGNTKKALITGKATSLTQPSQQIVPVVYSITTDSESAPLDTSGAINQPSLGGGSIRLYERRSTYSPPPSFTAINIVPFQQSDMSTFECNGQLSGNGENEDNWKEPTLDLFAFPPTPFPELANAVDQSLQPPAALTDSSNLWDQWMNLSDEDNTGHHNHYSTPAAVVGPPAVGFDLREHREHTHSVSTATNNQCHYRNNGLLLGGTNGSGLLPPPADLNKNNNNHQHQHQRSQQTTLDLQQQLYSSDITVFNQGEGHGQQGETSKKRRTDDYPFLTGHDDDEGVEEGEEVQECFQLDEESPPRAFDVTVASAQFDFSDKEDVDEQEDENDGLEAMNQSAGQIPPCSGRHHSGGGGGSHASTTPPMEIARRQPSLAVDTHSPTPGEEGFYGTYTSPTAMPMPFLLMGGVDTVGIQDSRVYNPWLAPDLSQRIRTGNETIVEYVGELKGVWLVPPKASSGQGHADDQSNAGCGKETEKETSDGDSGVDMNCVG